MPSDVFLVVFCVDEVLGERVTPGVANIRPTKSENVPVVAAIGSILDNLV